MNKEQVLGIFRHVLTFVGGIFVIKGIGQENTFHDLIGAVVTSVGTIWSLLKNKK